MRKHSLRCYSVHALLYAAILSAHAENLLAAIPADATPIDVTGVLTVLHADDFEHGKSSHWYFLEDKKNKEKFTIHFKGAPPEGLQSGATLRVHGVAKGRELYLDANGSSSGMETLAPATVVVSGQQNTLVIVADFEDRTVACPVSAIQDRMFTDPAMGSVDDLYRESSFNQVSFVGDVIGPYTINALSTDPCDVSGWTVAADAAAAANNINVNDYARRLYVLPWGNKCPFAGVAELGGIPSRAWTFRCDLPDTYAHELGHNLGMGHAATPTSGYGDWSDVMGISGLGLRQVNAPHKDQMGWLPPEQILIVTQSGPYDIAPTEADPMQATAPQMLKIAKPDTNEFYYLSYRQPVGFDVMLETVYTDGLSVHRYAGDGSAANTYLLQNLTDGASFVDSANAISVTQLSHAGDRVTVQVELSSTCQTGLPALAIMPSDQTGIAGTALDYTVSLTNADHVSCPQTTFNLTQGLPVSWSGNVSPSSLTLGPGQSATALLSVTSPVSATISSYGLTVTASDLTKPNHSNSGSASYSIVNDTQAPSAPTNVSATAKRGYVALAWSPANDNVGVTGYEIWRNNLPMLTTSGTSYADNAVLSNTTYTYYVVAIDAANNRSAPSNLASVTYRSRGKK